MSLASAGVLIMKAVTGGGMLIIHVHLSSFVLCNVMIRVFKCVLYLRYMFVCVDLISCICSVHGIYKCLSVCLPQ